MKEIKKYTEILFYSKWDSIEEWQKVFDKKNIKLLKWPSDFKDKTNYYNIKYAIVWDPSEKMWQYFPNLKLIQSLGAGVDHILTKNPPKNCVITRLEDPNLTNQMTEYAILSVLMCYRKYFQYNELKNKKKWNQISPFKAEEFKITVLGYGNIAKNIVKELLRFGFKINVWANKKRHLTKTKYYYGRKQLYKSVQESNCLINLLPHTSSTYNIINSSIFKILAPEAYFINIGRGKTVDEKDLIYALENKLLNGAILDVFKNEPLKKSSKLYTLKNVFITPHIAGITNPTNYAANILIQNIKSLNTKNKIKNKISLVKEY